MTPVYGALSDATGLVNRLDVQTGGHTFEVKTTSNFNITPILNLIKMRKN